MYPTFVFMPSRPEHFTLGEAAPTGAPQWEMRSIPGNLIGVGRTPKEATQSLIGLIEWTREDVSSFERWYLDAWDYADPGDEEVFDRVVAIHNRRLRKPDHEIGNREAYGLVAAPA